MVGFHRGILRKTRARCANPNCRVALDLTKYANTLFSEILRRVHRGESVRVVNFGTFSAKFVAGRTVTTFGGEKKEIPAYRVMRFKPCDRVKETLNTPVEDDVEEENAV